MSDTPHPLPPVDALTLVREALVHLICADRQSAPSDDRIIMEHVRAAIALLRPVAYPKRERAAA